MNETVPPEPLYRVPVYLVLTSIIGLWLCYFLLATLRGSIVGLDLHIDILWRRGLVTTAGMVVTLMMWLILRIFDSKSLRMKIFVALVTAAGFSLLISQINELAFRDIRPRAIEKIGQQQGMNVRQDEAGNILIDLPSMILDDSETARATGLPESFTIARAPTSNGSWRQQIAIALDRFYLLLAWSALYLALLAGAQAKAAERRESNYRDAAKAAELRSLRYQVNPHFLFNALNSLSALVMTGRADRAEEMIQTLSAFYRHSLADEPTADLPLADEFDLQRQYLEIETTRFPDRLRARIDLPDELSNCRVPGMILQPLVENSVKYGVSASKEPVMICISAREEYGRLVLTVADDGPGKAGTTTTGFGIGLANVRDRLVARFGEEASITSGETLDGYETELRLPLETHG